LQNRTWTDHSGFRISRGATRTGSEYASFYARVKKKKKRKKKTTGTGCVFSDTRHHLIDRNSIEGKRKFIYTKKEKEKE
jgi:hypothetical protein